MLKKWYNFLSFWLRFSSCYSFFLFSWVFVDNSLDRRMRKMIMRVVSCWYEIVAKGKWYESLDLLKLKKERNKWKSIFSDYNSRAIMFGVKNKKHYKNTLLIDLDRHYAMLQNCNPQQYQTRIATKYFFNSKFIPIWLPSFFIT